MKTILYRTLIIILLLLPFVVIPLFEKEQPKKFTGKVIYRKYTPGRKGVKSKFELWVANKYETVVGETDSITFINARDTITVTWK